MRGHPHHMVSVQLHDTEIIQLIPPIEDPPSRSEGTGPQAIR